MDNIIKRIYDSKPIRKGSEYLGYITGIPTELKETESGFSIRITEQSSKVLQVVVEIEVVLCCIGIKHERTHGNNGTINFNLIS